MTKVSEFDVTGCRRDGAHDVTARHTLNECPVYQAANTPEGVCTECNTGEYAHLRDCSVLAAETGRSYAEYADEHFVTTVKRTAQAIRDAADEFERDALNTIGTPTSNRGPRVIAVVRAMHSLHWGLANASTEQVIRDAAEADHAERLMKS